jgi:hypothetical protein
MEQSELAARGVLAVGEKEALAQAGAGRTIVLGEGMPRVRDAASRLGAATHDMWESSQNALDLSRRTGDWSIVMEQNRNWINNLVDEKYSFVDIGRMWLRDWYQAALPLATARSSQGKATCR